MPRDSFGRRSDDWGEEQQGNPTVRFLFQRSWLLIVPLIAVAWYNTRQLAPMVQKADQEILAEKQQSEEKRTKILSDARRLGVQISMLRALSDTLDVRFSRYDGLIDSVMTLRDAEQQEVRLLEAHGDSLRAVYSQAMGKEGELSAMLPPMQARIDSLKALIAVRDEEISQLEAAKQADQDQAERVLRPNLFRKNTALVTGAGQYPNRDALPKR